MTMITESGSRPQGFETVLGGNSGNSIFPGCSQVGTDEDRFGEHSDRDNISTNSVISTVAPRNAIISIAVIDGHTLTREAITRSLQHLCGLLEIQSFTTCDEYFKVDNNNDVILYHLHQRLAGAISDTVALSIKKLISTAPVIILCDADSSESICAAFDLGVRGYIPTISTNLELAIEIVFLVKVGGTFVPPSGLSSRRVKPPGTSDPATTQFTMRQVEVLDRLMLGKTNKLIAYELKMSESSVKTHIRNIMRKMNAANRTEVACRAHQRVVLEV
jgi:DNA-binding NarL/FixJ family response regulator